LQETEIRLGDHVPTTTQMRKGAALLAATSVAAAGLAAEASAGMTSAQAGKLQREIDDVLRHAAPGARQIAPNRVAWSRDGVTLTIPATGTARVAGARSDCRLKRACVWEHADFQGRRVSFFHYGTYRLARYGLRPRTDSGASSYYNHQTGGAWAVFRVPLSAGTFTVRAGESNNFGAALNDTATTITLEP
jgi:hypothetical protein